jgi:hypothetical protein
MSPGALTAAVLQPAPPLLEPVLHQPQQLLHWQAHSQVLTLQLHWLAM